MKNTPPVPRESPKLLTRIVNEGFACPFLDSDQEEFKAALRMLLPLSPVIVADAPAAGFVAKWLQPDGSWDMGHDINNVAPPFPGYWIESAADDGRVGFLINAGESASGGWTVKGMCGTGLPGARVILPAFTVAYDVQASGELAGDIEVSSVNREAHAGATELCARTFFPLLAVHGLLHCKNVALSDEPVDANTSRRMSKRFGDRDGGYRFHTLLVRGMSAKADDRDEGPGAHGVPLSVVRGHYKSFSEAKPLFGKLTGRYWWQSHARGDAAVGIVDKDYQVAAPAESAGVA